MYISWYVCIYRAWRIQVCDSLQGFLTHKLCLGDVTDKHTHTLDCIQPVCITETLVQAACYCPCWGAPAHLQLEPSEIIMIILPSCITFHQEG